MPSQQEIADSQALIIQSFQELRPKLMATYGNISHIRKQDNSVVTDLDIEIETIIKNKIIANFPVFSFRGEETEPHVGQANATWYVDPIDSTASYIQGLPYCSNMAGLVVDGEIVASVVYHFASEEMFTAIKGKGTYKNGQPITVKNVELNESYIFADAYSYKELHELYKPSGTKFYAPLGATGYFMTRLAQGSIHGVCYAAANIKIHDVVPGALLVTEAGGNIVPFKGVFSPESTQFVAGTQNIATFTRSIYETKH